MSKTSTIFFGSGNFAVKILENLLTLDYLDIKAVITQPDKEAGRKKKLTPPPLKKFLDSESPVAVPHLLQPEKIKLASAEILKNFKPELIIVADYGQMIPNDIIDYPKYKCLNIHGSLLPKYRGAVPAAMAILNGESITGVSIPVMTYGLDNGAIIASRETMILPKDTTLDLRMRLAVLANELLNDVLPQWLKGKIQAIPEDESKATLTWEKDLSKEKAQIKLDTTAEQAERMVRAFSPWPIAWVKVNFLGKEKRLKIYSAQSAEAFNSHQVGIFFKQNKKLFLSLQGGILELQQLQLEGKNLIKAKDALFLNQTTMLE